MTKKKHRKEKRQRKIDRSQAESYDYHLPVLLKESVDFLVTTVDGIYVDGTLGGGGHSAEIIRRLSSRGRLFAFDKDEQAITHCRTKFSEELGKGNQSRLILINDSFSKACSIEGIKGATQGILLDLGVSSRQLDQSSRGFSYRVDTPLDMRFIENGQTAEEFLNAASEEEIEGILRLYGEEPFASSITRRILQLRRVSFLKTTFDLRSAVEDAVPPSQRLKSLSRVFQAVRIHVNRELEVLEDTLTNCVPALAGGGRIVVISYHSLEDRIVKNIFRQKSKRQRTSRYKTTETSAIDMPELKLITPKPIIPSPEEILRNPRARSAKMRVAEKL